jgi:hypothetical protein
MSHLGASADGERKKKKGWEQTDINKANDSLAE